MLGLPVVENRSLAGERMVWGVAALLHAVSDALAARFAACTIRGEISGFSRASSGHCYLNLKDADGSGALIRCAMFRRAASLLDFAPADGQLVEVRGRLSLYEPRGELQFVIEAMQRAGAGALFEQFLKLKARLEAEGLFDAQRKRRLPPFPQCIGVVTSLAAAALHDVLTALSRRAPHVRVIVYPCLVQGSDAPATIVTALETAARRAETDVLIVCRGGGSLEDLWAFNDERVVRAIAAFPVPVLCGVGHETDITLSDFAADVRAPTPTAAAELASPLRQECFDELAAIASVMARRMYRVIDVQSQALDRATLRLTRPVDGVRRQSQRLGHLQQRMAAHALRCVPRQVHRGAESQARLCRAAASMFFLHRHRLSAIEGRLMALDPHQVLARGYAWLADGQGQPIVTTAALTPGQQVHAVLSDGEVTATIASVRATPR